MIWRWLDGGQVVVSAIGILIEHAAHLRRISPTFGRLPTCCCASSPSRSSSQSAAFSVSTSISRCKRLILPRKILLTRRRNNRTTLENLRPCLPPVALIEPGPATPPSQTMPSSSPDPPPAYSSDATAPSPTPGSPRSAHPHTSRTRGYRWQWRWKPDHLLTRNERKLVRHVAQNVNIYDRGDAWMNFLAVVEGEDDGGEADVEMGGSGRRRMGGYRRAARWFWPSPLEVTGYVTFSVHIPPLTILQLRHTSRLDDPRPRLSDLTKRSRHDPLQDIRPSYAPADRTPARARRGGS